MHAMSTRKELHIPAQHHLLGRLAWCPRPADLELMCVFTFIAIGLLASFYLTFFCSFSEEISSALAALS
jgi:hypothetical protein